ncbi:UNVERIFIED_CONTAM: hypothetical protein FKN15_053664 [Acipenser sinensis]
MGCFLLGLLLPLLSLKPVRVLGAMDSCWDDLGRANRCMPRFENAVFNRTVIVSNVCGSPPEDYCKQTGSSKSCHRCDAMHPGLHHNATYLNDFHNDEEPTWWQSQSMFHGVQYPNSVNLTLHLGKSYEISYIRLKFHTSRPESFAIYKRTHEGGSWIPYQYYSATCGKTYRRNSKGYLRPGEDEQQATCTDEFSDISPLTGGNVAFSTLEGRPSAYNFDHSPVLPCACHPAGSVGLCNPLNGKCSCKENVEGYQCDRCKPGTFNLDSQNPAGCTSCFCYGHSAACTSAVQYSAFSITSDFTEGKFLGDKLLSYGQPLSLTFKGESEELLPSFVTLIIEGSGMRMSARLFPQNKTVTDSHPQQTFVFSIVDYCGDDKIRMEYSLLVMSRYVFSPTDTAQLSEVTLVSAAPGLEPAAPWVEECICPQGYVGQFCEFCAPGYKRETPSGGPFTRCVPCTCNQHGVCDGETGLCQCRDNTVGSTCERCADGFYGNPLIGTSGDCLLCPCPHQSSCAVIPDTGEELAVKCVTMVSTVGARGQWKPCRPCQCSGNVDPNAVGVCDHATGRCLKCLHNTEGDRCERCKDGYYGNALDRETLHKCKRTRCEMCDDGFHGDPVGARGQWKPCRPCQCSGNVDPMPSASVTTRPGAASSVCTTQKETACNCSPSGSVSPSAGCGAQTGQCECLSHVTGRDCGHCETGFFNLRPGEGCQRNHLIETTGSFPGGNERYSLFKLYRDHLEQDAPATPLVQYPVLVTQSQDSVRAAQGSRGQRVTCVVKDSSAFLPGVAGELAVKCVTMVSTVGARGQWKPCRPCQCSGNVDPNAVGVCDHATGRCLKCLHNTEGDRCERCKDGYYGNALDRETLHKCKRTRCEMCDDGFHGDPVGARGQWKPCRPCQCSGNVDPNAVGVCDHATGRCLKCLHNTEGDRCERCKDGYYGNALDRETLHKCKPCNCSPSGSVSPSAGCGAQTGQCECLSHVTGRDCGHCETGFFNLRPGEGCQRCTCNPTGSVSSACHPITGQCSCRPGVEGSACDLCRKGFFSFSARGCRACNCSPMGSVTMQCHGNGTCLCREGFVGDKCDQCKVNYFHSRATHQCEECPVCYGLVRDEAAKLKEKLQALEEELKKYDCQSHRGYEHYPVQREGSLSNSLEDLLAMQNARDAFLKQFMELETSVRTIQERLSNISRDLNCSGAGNDKHCSALSDTGSSIQATQGQLQLARETLDNMVIPHDLPREPNKWTILVNESQVLAVSQKSLADYMESIAKKALWASKQTLSLLSTIVEDHSTESYVRDLAGQYFDMHEAKANLTESVEETLTEAKKTYSSVQRINTEIAEVLTNITDSHREIPLSDAMRNKTEELDRLSQSKEELISKAVLELQPQIDSMIKSMESVQQLDPLMARASESQSLALASVVKGKEVDAEASALLKELEGMKKTWSRKQTQTKVAVKKMRTVKEKIVVDAKKKTKQAVNTVTPAVSNSTQANATAREAQRLATEASAIAGNMGDVREDMKTAKRSLDADGETDAKAALKQTEKSGRMTTELNSTVSAVLHEVAAQEMKAAELKRDMREMEEIAGNMGDVREDMKTAKRSLESYALVLKDLLAKLETSQVNERFESLLNETETQLRILQLGVQSEGLGLRIQTLQEAARQQESQMKEMEKDIAEILEEKINLEDVVQNFPEGCFNRPQTGRCVAKTETQLRILQLGVQSEGLGLRIQTLQEAARQQESQMKEMEKDIAEILEEKINLEDVVQNFPEGCFNRPQTGRR